jgi:alkanesulfonate monooxygenase SsuD/methylene tetrahydromethanopterin reductase-like flavin-dependent oxidoreductase (luciferase family)
VTLDFGLMFPFRNPDFARIPWDTLYRNDLDLAVEAERLGYDHVWLTEHHFVDDGYSPSLLAIAAAIAARTESIRIGTFVLLLPLHDPLRVAEDSATVDLISAGRFDLGLGLGYRVAEFTGTHVPTEERGARLQEGATLIQRLFTEQDITFDGRFRKLSHVTMIPPAVQKPHPPIWLAARAPKAIDRAARHGFHLAGVGGVGSAKAYDEALQKHGRRPEDHSIAQLRAVFVAPTREAAWQAAARPLHHMLRCYAEWFAEAGDLEGDDAGKSALRTPEEMIAKQEADVFGERAIIGTPEDAIQAIEDYLARGRTTHLVMATSLPGLPHQLARDSMRLFARQVMPRFR